MSRNWNTIGPPSSAACFSLSAAPRTNSTPHTTDICQSIAENHNHSSRIHTLSFPLPFQQSFTGLANLRKSFQSPKLLDKKEVFHSQPLCWWSQQGLLTDCRCQRFISLLMTGIFLMVPNCHFGYWTNTNILYLYGRPFIG